jgi:hypothetical protein
MNIYKQKIIDKRDQLNLILKQGEEIEKQTNGEKPDWKQVA